MFRFSLSLALLAAFLFAPPVAALEHETHVTLGHDLHTELSQHLKLPSGLTLSARVGSQDGQHANIDLSGAGCLIDGGACTAGNVAAAAAALGSQTLVSVGGTLGYELTLEENALNFSATASWIEGAFTPGLEARVTRDIWVAYASWQEDISGAISSSLAEYDVDIGKAGVVRIGLGLKF